MKCGLSSPQTGSATGHPPFLQVLPEHLQHPQPKKAKPQQHDQYSSPTQRYSLRQCVHRYCRAPHHCAHCPSGLSCLPWGHPHTPAHLAGAFSMTFSWINTLWNRCLSVFILQVINQRKKDIFISGKNKVLHRRKQLYTEAHSLSAVKTQQDLQMLLRWAMSKCSLRFCRGCLRCPAGRQPYWSCLQAQSQCMCISKTHRLKTEAFLCYQKLLRWTL